jgi:hypothetical protein
MRFLIEKEREREKSENINNNYKQITSSNNFNLSNTSNPYFSKANFEEDQKNINDIFHNFENTNILLTK